MDPFDELAGALNKRDQWLEGGPPEVQAQKQQEDQKAEALPAVQSLRLEMAKRDSTVGKVQWADESVPLQQRIGDFVQTHAVAEAQRKDKPDYDSTDWERIAGQAQQFFPGVDAEKLKQPFLEGRQQAYTGLNLAAAKEHYKNFEEPGFMTLMREGLPFATTGWNFWEKSQYADAKERMAKGEYSPGDYARIAHFEKLQENKQNESLGKSAVRAALNVGTFAGEAWAGGAALKGVGILPTIRMGGAAVAETPTLAARIIGKTALTRTAAQTALMPSMWLPQSVDQAMQKGGNWSDIKNLGPAYGMGMMQVGLLGAASKAGGSEAAAKLVPGIAEGGVKGWATRLVTGTGVAMGGQAGIDVTNGLLTKQFPVWGHKSYGTAVELAEGKEGAPKAMLMQLLTFALFNVGHAHNNPLGEARAAEAADGKAIMGLGAQFVGRLKSAGYGEDAAYNEAAKAHKVIMEQIQGKNFEGAKAGLSKMAQQYVDALGEHMKVDQLAAEQKTADMAAKNPNVGQFRGQFGADQPTAAPEGPVNAPESTPAAKAANPPEAETAPHPQPQRGLQGVRTPTEQAATKRAMADQIEAQDPEAAKQMRAEADAMQPGARPARAPAEPTPTLEQQADVEAAAKSLGYKNAKAMAKVDPKNLARVTEAVTQKAAQTPKPTESAPERYYRVPSSKKGAGETNVDEAISELAGKSFSGKWFSRTQQGNEGYFKPGRVQFEFDNAHLADDPLVQRGEKDVTIGGKPPMYLHPALSAIRFRGEESHPDFVRLKTLIDSANESRQAKGLDPIKLEATEGARQQAPSPAESLPKPAETPAEPSRANAEPAPEAPVPRGTPEAARPPNPLQAKQQQRFQKVEELSKGVTDPSDLALLRDLRNNPNDYSAREVEDLFTGRYQAKGDEASSQAEVSFHDNYEKTHPDAARGEADAAWEESISRGPWRVVGTTYHQDPSASGLFSSHATEADAHRAMMYAKQQFGGAGFRFRVELKNPEAAPRPHANDVPMHIQEVLDRADLTPREKAVLEGRAQGNSHQDLEAEFGVKRQRVAQIEQEAMAKLGLEHKSMAEWLKAGVDEAPKGVANFDPEVLNRIAKETSDVPDESLEDRLREEFPETYKAADDLDAAIRNVSNSPEVKDATEKFARSRGNDPEALRREIESALQESLAAAKPPDSPAATEGAAGEGRPGPAAAAPTAGREAAGRELKFRTVAQEIQARGGISLKSFADIHGKEITAEFQKEFPGMFRGRNLRGGSNNFEELVDDLVRHHVITVPEGMKATDAILELIKGRALDLSQNLDAKYQQESEAYARQQAALEQAGVPLAAVEGARALGEELADAEDSQRPAEENRPGQALGGRRVAADAGESVPEPSAGEESPGDQGTAGRPGDFDFGANATRPVRGVGPERPEPSDAVMDAAKEFAKQEGGHVVPEAILSRAYDLAQRLQNTVRFVQNNWREFAGNQFPRTARLTENVAQKMIEWVHAKTAAIYGSPKYIDQIMGPKATQAQRRMAGAVETEWRLEFMHDAYQNRSVDLLAQARKTKAGPEYARLTALAQEARQDAANVGTIIGAKDSPLQTDAQFRAELAKPEHQEIQRRWDANGGMKDIMEENFKKAMGLDPQDAIDNFTQRPGHPINLKNLGPNDALTSSAIQSIPRGPSRGNLGNVRQSRLGFSRQAKGTGTYDIDLGAIITNSLGKGLSAAGRAEALKAMIAEGVATVGEPFKTKEGYTEFKNTFPEAGNALAAKGETSLYVKNESAGEYRQALQVDEAPKYPLIAGFNQVLTRAALASSVEFVYHGKNLLTFLFKPGVRLPDLLKNAYDVVRNAPEGQARLFELAKAGRMKAPGLESGLLLGERAKSIDPTYHASRVLDGVQKIMRLTASDAFDRMSGDKADFIAEAVKSITGKYPFEKGELNKTNFINQLGQYNKRSQNSLLVLLRDTGISPFATAGTNYYVQSMRGLTGASGARTTGLGGEIASRGEYFAKVGAVLGTVAAINYFAWKRSDGDDDVPMGSIKVGEKNGKSQYLDLTSLTGLTRAARQTGLLAIAEGERAGGKKATEAAEEDKAFNNIVDSLLHPFVGPGAAAVHTAITGRSLAGYDIRQPASAGFDPATGASQPKEGDARRNLAAAAWQANPALEVFRPEIQKKFGVAVSPKDKAAQQPVEDRAMKLLGPFGIKTKLGGRRK